MALFDAEFFPTPRALIKKMLAPYMTEHGMRDMTVLEPSAGKGDIANYILDKMHPGGSYGGRYDSNVYCIESHPDLQAILREKGFPIIGDDFLRFTGNGILFDLVVMNPPFSGGARHLLHAWEVLRHGDIVCLLNRETIANPFTQERRLLLQLIEDHGGTVEDAGAAFTDAERKTKVEVCIVRLSKTDDVLLDGLLDTAQFTQANPFDSDVPLINENQVACRDVLKRMVASYDAALASFPAALKVMRELAYYGKEFDGEFDHEGVAGVFFNAVGRGVINADSREDVASDYLQAFNEFATKVRRAAWGTVFSKTEMARYMTEGVRREFESLQKQRAQVEFTEANITSLVEALLMNSGKIAESAIVESFDVMTKYHEENRIHIEGWKTNDCWRVNKRFILPYVIDASWSSRLRLSYTKSQELDDIDRGLCFLEGKRFDQIHTIQQAIRAACDNGARECTSLFFKIRFFKKGTAHFTFRDLDVWERFNVAACKGKKWLPETTDKHHTKRKAG